MRLLPRWNIDKSRLDPFNIAVPPKLKPIPKAKAWTIKRYFPIKTILINMEMINGTHKTFIAWIKNNEFTHKKNTYIIDNDLRYFNETAKMYTLDYHEQCSLPIKRQIPLSVIEKGIRSTEYKDIRYAINPSLLRAFIKSKITEAVMRGAIDDTLKKIVVLLVITTLASVFHLLLFMQKSGLFAQFTGGS